MDKAGNFIGWLHVDGLNLSVALVEHSLSRVHFAAERSPYGKALLAAEESARQRRQKVGGGPNGGPNGDTMGVPMGAQRGSQ